MDWGVIEKYKKNVDILDIKEPPCKKCEYFKPHRIYDKSGIYDGLTICISKEMWHDFSCYKDKDDV